MESITGFITTIGDEDVVDVARESTDSEDEVTMLVLHTM